MFPRVGLEDTCHETLREEEAGDPEAGRVALGQPIVHELHPVKQVAEPTHKRFQRGVGGFLPVLGHLPIQHRNVHRVKFLGHYHQTLDCLLKLF